MFAGFRGGRGKQLQCRNVVSERKHRNRVLLWTVLLYAGTTLLYLTCGIPQAVDAVRASPETPASERQVQSLSFCGDAKNRDISRRLLYVSTLDGSVTALDLQNSGKLKWSLKTGPDSMLSSSIHRLELTNNGQMVRMIPSLYGSLYKFDGDNIEQIPVTADHLLSSSYKFSDDLVISGGKETRSYGISARTGKVVYECSMHGCRNTTELDAKNTERHGPPREYTIEEDYEHDPLVDDIVVVRRETQTVRAVEPRTGGERWNFSVGHHELEVLKPHDCHDRPLTIVDQMLSELQLKIIVPDGIVCAVKKNDPEVVLWQYKFDHPIVNAWKTNADDQLESVNLFSIFQLPVRMTIPKPSTDGLEPSVYVGMYNKQLYIQESAHVKKSLLSNQLDALNRNFLKIPWKPFAAKNSLALVGIDADQVGNPDEHAVMDIDRSTDVLDRDAAAAEHSVTALSILYATEYANGNGFFLFLPSDLNKTSLCSKENGSKEFDDDEPSLNGAYDFPFADDDTPTKIIIVSLWFWWKEIMVISLTTALILNVVLSRRIASSREVVIVERHVEIKVPAEPIDEESANSRRSISESQNSSDSAPFVSRYQADFDMVQCLGKGGFGVVFEVRNKLDDCRYAIKRIQLPNRQESRDRVMREVKTLANCEHQNIVRYFQAWVETPPTGWQEQEDRAWMERGALSHSIDIDTPSVETTSRPVTTHNNATDLVFSKPINRNDRLGLDAWITNLNTNECLNFDDDNRKTAFVDDDSLVEFLDDCDNCCSDSVFGNGVSEPSVDIVFTNEMRAHPQRPPRQQSTQADDDSFQIVFQKPDDDSKGPDDETGPVDDDAEQQESSDDNSSSSSSGAEESFNEDQFVDDNDDSFQIEFNADHNSASSATNLRYNYNLNDESSSSFKIEFKHSSDAGASGDHQARSSGVIKQRTFSENCHSSRRIGGDIPESPSGGGAVHDGNNMAMEPFKRTHRRPMSLDLTAAARERKVVALANNRMYLYIQMQLCKKQSLKDWLRLNDLSTRQRDIVCIFKQIVEGVEYCHLKGLIHRDLKPSNIFFSLDGQIKIGDFGLVTGMSEIPNTPCSHRPGQRLCAKHTQQVGTQLYMSPEQLKGQQYNYKVDIYSLGLIFFELLVVFGTEMERIETMKALRLSNFPKDFSMSFPNEFELLKMMLSQAPDQRPTTIGIRARPPLGFSADALLGKEWHFELPPRRRNSHISGLSSSSSRDLTSIS